MIDELNKELYLKAKEDISNNVLFEAQSSLINFTGIISNTVNLNDIKRTYKLIFLSSQYGMRYLRSIMKIFEKKLNQ